MGRFEILSLLEMLVILQLILQQQSEMPVCRSTSRTPVTSAVTSGIGIEYKSIFHCASEPSTNPGPQTKSTRVLVSSWPARHALILLEIFNNNTNWTCTVIQLSSLHEPCASSDDIYLISA